MPACVGSPPNAAYTKSGTNEMALNTEIPTRNPQTATEATRRSLRRSSGTISSTARRSLPMNAIPIAATATYSRSNAPLLNAPAARTL